VAAVGFYRRLKRRQGLKRRFVAISDNVESDYLFSKIEKKLNVKKIASVCACVPGKKGKEK
jgi:hypothetical protein